MTGQEHTSSPADTNDDAWTAALTSFVDASARFKPVCDTLSSAERAYFALKREEGHEASRGTMAERCAKKRLDKAYEDDRTFGAALHEALQALLQVPAPTLSALVRKVEIVTRHASDDECVKTILVDLKLLLAKTEEREPLWIAEQRTV